MDKRVFSKRWIFYANGYIVVLGFSFISVIYKLKRSKQMLVLCSSGILNMTSKFAKDSNDLTQTIIFVLQWSIPEPRSVKMENLKSTSFIALINRCAGKQSRGSDNKLSTDADGYPESKS